MYHFVTHWRVRATDKEVFDVLSDPIGLKRWWPSVYLDVKVLDPGDPATHEGRLIGLHTKGWLPYTLKWQFTVTRSNPPHGFELVAMGDFMGIGIWTLTQQGEFAHVTYDWQVAVRKPLIRYLSPVFRPVFGANHRWAMARGLESLELELRRRRGESVPAPPGPTFAGR